MIPRQPSLPRPIDDGRSPQAVVEYLGRLNGAQTYIGRVSKKVYYFGADPGHKFAYVREEDLFWFKQHPEFRIVEEGRIDPQAQQRGDLLSLRKQVEEAQDQIRQLGAQLTVVMPAAAEVIAEPPTQAHAGGRPEGQSFGAWLNCVMSCGEFGKGLYSAKESYDLLLVYALSHFDASFVPVRGNFANDRSYAKKRSEAKGHCIWHRHPEQICI